MKTPKVNTIWQYEGPDPHPLLHKVIDISSETGGPVVITWSAPGKDDVGYSWMGPAADFFHCFVPVTK